MNLNGWICLKMGHWDYFKYCIRWSERRSLWNEIQNYKFIRKYIYLTVSLPKSLGVGGKTNTSNSAVGLKMAKSLIHFVDLPPLCLDNKGNRKGENVKTSKFCKVLPWWSQDSCLSRHDLWMKYIWVWGQFKGHYLWSTKTIYCQPNGIQTSSSTQCPHSSPRARLGIDDELGTLVPDAVGVVVDVLPGEPCWPLVVHVMELVVPLWAHSW